ncbi:MAG: VWA domain-containing protein [Elusimicrobia bacterium]|nr:VWA domain-containing protein [Elusimicrobiota bacterium]
MTWDRPAYLFILLFIPVLAVLLLLRGRRRRLYLERSVRPAGLIMISWRKTAVKNLLLAAALVFLLAALAGPRWGRVWQEIKKPGKDAVFLIDTSVSMQAADIKPSRMEKAKDKMRFMVENMKGVRAGLVFFAGTAFLQCPVTFDKNALRMFLNEAWDKLIPLPGSNIEEALQTADGAFPPGSGSARYIVLLTDGEELQGNALKAAEELKKNNTKIIALGIARKDGAPIPVYSNNSLSGYKKDSKGNTVLSRLNRELLEKLASITGGYYAECSNDISDAAKILDIIQKGPENKKEDRLAMKMEHRYQYPLFIAVLFLMLELIVSERKE